MPNPNPAREVSLIEILKRTHPVESLQKLHTWHVPLLSHLRA